MEWDSQADQQNQTESLPTTMTLKRKAEQTTKTKKTNVSSLFMCVLSERAIAFWTSPRILEVAYEDNHFFTMGR